MPVHSAGPRLYHAVKFKHLVKRSGSGSAAKPSNISLNLVPFVDMMTILVCFLLMVFSSTGALLQAQKGLEHLEAFLAGGDTADLDAAVRILTSASVIARKQRGVWGG